MSARVRSAVLISLASLSLGCLFSSSALATTGPEWIVGASKTPLSGVIAGTGTVIHGTVFVAEGLATIECTGGTGSGAIHGGNPGTGTGKGSFTGCHISTSTSCVATTSGQVAGTVATALLETELVYPATNTASALLATYPASGTELAKFTLSGGAEPCGALNGKTLTVTAGGTAAPTGGPITAGQKCASLTQVGKETAGNFELTASGEVSLLGAGNRPAEAIQKASLRDAAGTTEITCEQLTNEKSSNASGLGAGRLITNEVSGWK